MIGTILGRFFAIFTKSRPEHAQCTNVDTDKAGCAVHEYHDLHHTMQCGLWRCAHRYGGRIPQRKLCLLDRLCLTHARHWYRRQHPDTAPAPTESKFGIATYPDSGQKWAGIDLHTVRQLYASISTNYVLGGSGSEAVMSTLAPGRTWMLSTPASTPAASLERKGFHTLYSTFSPSPTCASLV
jgi:hypothetical protein